MSRPFDQTNLPALGAGILAIVERRGFPSLKAACVATGLNYPQVHQIVRGLKSPRAETLERIVTALGGTMAEVYSRS